MPNLFDVEDAFMQGSVDFDKVIAEFEAEWNEPMIIMAAGLDMWLNQDVYLGGVDNGEGGDLQPEQEDEVRQPVQYSTGQPYG